MSWHENPIRKRRSKKTLESDTSWSRKLYLDELLPSVAKKFDHAAFLGDEGVDAGGFDVEVVSDRPLLPMIR